MDQTAAAPHPQPALPRLTAEALGTAVLVLVGCGTLAATGQALPTAAAFGLTLLLLLGTVCRGADLNPALSVGAVVAGQRTGADALGRVAAQCAGAVAAGLVLLVLFLGYRSFTAGSDSLGRAGYGDEFSGYAWWAAFLLEVVLTAVLALLVLAVGTSPQAADRRALVVAGATAAVTLPALPATGAGLNPARALGPGLFSGLDGLADLWLFLVAPALGAVLGALLARGLPGSDAGGAPRPGGGPSGGGRLGRALRAAVRAARSPGGASTADPAGRAAGAAAPTWTPEAAAPPAPPPAPPAAPPVDRPGPDDPTAAWPTTEPPR